MFLSVIGAGEGPHQGTRGRSVDAPPPQSRAPSRRTRPAAPRSPIKHQIHERAPSGVSRRARRRRRRGLRRTSVKGSGSGIARLARSVMCGDASVGSAAHTHHFTISHASGRSRKSRSAQSAPRAEPPAAAAAAAARARRARARTPELECVAELGPSVRDAETVVGVDQDPAALASHEPQRRAERSWGVERLLPLRLDPLAFCGVVGVRAPLRKRHSTSQSQIPLQPCSPPSKPLRTRGVRGARAGRCAAGWGGECTAGRGAAPARATRPPSPRSR